MLGRRRPQQCEPDWLEFRRFRRTLFPKFLKQPIEPARLNEVQIMARKRN
jgi:hypothetical protein